jgi:hypothetical protein
MNMSVAIGNVSGDREVAFEHRKKMIQRKDVSDMYKKQANFFQSKPPTLSDLEDLLTGKMEQDGDTEEVADAVRVFQELEKQPKHTLAFGNAPIYAILGSTPEETIQLMEHVRRAALAPVNPTTQDLRIAASATTRIQHAQGEVALNMRKENQIELEVQRQKEIEAEALNRTVQVDFQQPNSNDADMVKLKQLRLFEEAVAKYSFQVEMKRYGFSEHRSSFYRIA